MVQRLCRIEITPDYTAVGLGIAFLSPVNANAYKTGIRTTFPAVS